MQLAIIVAIISANAFAMAAPQLPADSPVLKLILSLVTCVGSVAMVRYVTTCLQTRVNWDRIQCVLLFALVGVTYGALDYAQVVRFNLHIDHLILVDDLALLAPILIYVILSWAALADRARAEPLPPGICNTMLRLRFACGIARHQLLPTLVPVLAVLAVTDLMRLMDSPLARIVEAVLITFVLVAVIVLTPWLLKICWKTDSLPQGDRRRQLENVFRRARLRVGDILIWKTDRRIVNAVVAGVLPTCRYVFLTDALVERLDDERLSAVVAHEAGHIRHGHLFRLLMSLQIPLFSLMIVQLILARANAATPAMQTCGLAVIVAGWIVIHARIARLLEHQADIAACHILAGSTRLEAQAVAIYEDALTCAIGDSSSSDWLHPSLPKRLGMLRYLSRNASNEIEFETQITRLNWLIMGTVCALAAIWLALV